MPSTRDKNHLLKQVARQVAACPRCPELVRNRTHAVPGSGNAGGAIMLIGEAPGKEEDRRGEPFVGAAGETLNRLLGAVGLGREKVFITSVIKCRPPNNRNPTRQEIDNYRPYLKQQIEIIRPKVIGALGATAAHWLTNSRKRVGHLREAVHTYRDIPVACTYHPAYVRRNPAVEPTAREDLRLLLEQVPDL